MLSRSIPLSSDALFSPFVESVECEWGSPMQHQQRVVLITIKSSCLRPYFMVRLSGPSLVPMQRVHHFAFNNETSAVAEIDGEHYASEGWGVQYLFKSNKTKVTNSDDGHKITLSVITMAPVPITGVYFIEILHLACHSTIDTIENDCLPESLDAMQLNRHFAMFLHETQVPYGYWYTQDQPGVVLTETRYQSNGRSSRSCSDRHCDIAPLEKFHFRNHFNNSWTVPSSKRFCFLGDSHSYVLAQYLAKEDSLTTILIPCLYPADYNHTSISAQITDNKCDALIIAMGQWPLSFQYMNKYNTSRKFLSPDRFLTRMKAIADHLFHHHSTVSVAFRSIHYGALTTDKTHCPPIDFRTPMLVDAYNEQLRILAETHSAFQQQQQSGAFQFIDTSLIIRAVWDSARDYSHYDKRVTLVEGRFIIQCILRRDEGEWWRADSPHLGNTTEFVSGDAAGTSNATFPILFSWDIFIMLGMLIAVCWTVGRLYGPFKASYGRIKRAKSRV
jgi:pterin-4a-carbinolamine dehydratase